LACCISLPGGEIELTNAMAHAALALDVEIIGVTPDVTADHCLVSSRDGVRPHFEAIRDPIRRQAMGRPAPGGQEARLSISVSR